jgi:ubiquinone/menaquinone biosynthesis C-methylase UbiE
MSRSNLATTQARAPSYIIRGGVQGRERLRVLSRVMRPTTLALLERAGLREAMCCLDLGCGGGDVSLDMARIVGPHGRVVGVDMDEVKLEAARSDAAAARLSNVEFRRADVLAGELPAGGFDVAYARFLLTHLTEPNCVLARMRDLLVPGGLLILDWRTSTTAAFSSTPPPGRTRPMSTSTGGPPRRAASIPTSAGACPA